MARPHKLSEAERLKAYDMYLKNKPLIDIAYQYKVSISTINRIIKKYNDNQGTNNV